MRSGCVYLVGAGPGDPGLLTVRGRQLLSRADVVVYDALAAPELLAYARPEAERIYVGKRASRHSRSQGEIEELLIKRAREGAVVVRLKGGDPFVFGRGGEEALALAEAGMDFEVVPGVTAGIAAPACAGIPVTHRGLAGCVTLLTGHDAVDTQDAALNWRALAQLGGTLAVYMGVGELRHICSRLIEHGFDPDTPAAAVQWGTTPRQKTVAATVETLPEASEAQGIEPPAIILIGGVVRLREKIKWLERRRLFGCRVVVTRARVQAPELLVPLRELGADVIELPTIRIEPAEDREALKQAAVDASAYDWIIFTSQNGVEAFFSAVYEAGLDARALAGCRVTAIGPATAERLKDNGLRADVQPDTYTSAAVVEAVAAAGDLAGSRVLWPRADAAAGDMHRSLEARGANVRDVVAYRVVPEEVEADEVVNMLSENRIDWVTFTSPSTARNFLAAVSPELLGSGSARIATIGPVTSKAVTAFGLVPSAEAESHTIPGLIEAILKHTPPEGQSR